MPTVILMYHRLSREQAQPYAVPVPAFTRHMRMLAASGAAVVSLDAASGMTKAARRSRHLQVCLTFDDGCEDFYTLAAPILSDHGFTAAVFMTTAFIGKTAPFDGADTTFLSRSMLQELHAAGFDIQSHTATHRDLTTLSPDALMQEMSGSRSMLEDILGAPVHHVAYPYGRYNDSVVQAAAGAGYRYGYCAGHCPSGPYTTARMAVRGGDSPLAFSLKMKGVAGSLRSLKCTLRDRIFRGPTS